MVKNPSSLSSSFNPSGMKKRLCVSFFGAIAFAIAIYMGLYEWKLIDSVWDPVFGDQTQKVLDSPLSHQLVKLFHIPDAIMGALAYLGDIIFALAGCNRRWQYRPWLVLLFGLNVIPLGVVSATLVAMQGTVVGFWCFPCMITATISLLLIVFAYEEVWASLRYLNGIWKRTGSKRFVWNSLWGRSSLVAYEVGESMREKN